MAAMTGATGARSWLQSHHLTWLTEKRLRRGTIALFVAAFGFSSIGLSGSTAPVRPAGHHAQVARALSR